MNAPTIIIALFVAVVFVAIVRNEIKKRKSERGGCSCGCGSCGMADICHERKQQEDNAKDLIAAIEHEDAGKKSSASKT